MTDIELTNLGATGMNGHTDDQLCSAPGQRVIKILRKTPGMTRAEIAESTSMPRSTVSAAVRHLLESRVVEEYACADSTGGRRPTKLRVAPAVGNAFVAELGQHHARLAIASREGELLATDDIKINIEIGPEKTIKALAKGWHKLGDEIPGAVVSAGLAVPGPVDGSGHVVGAARMPGWSGKDIAGMLAQELAVPSVIENDARAATIGEWNCRGRHRDSCIYVKAGTGIGAGWVSGGVAYRGSRGLAGDITHLRVHTDNPLPCTCGNSGCLETVASGAAILRQLGRLGSSISTTSQLVTAENSGDPQAVSLVRDAGMRLGEVLSNLVNFLNPVRIVLGGSMSQMGSLLAGVRSELYERCLPMCTEDLVIETSACGADAPLIGMSILDSHMPISQEGNR